ncbi:hypothetical protein B0H11DRAFT_2305374 [Mycena galericulata]|nr:hypothetical protein B0H11DRAFT_2305374 [Mycena galericulata]
MVCGLGWFAVMKEAHRTVYSFPAPVRLTLSLYNRRAASGSQYTSHLFFGVTDNWRRERRTSSRGVKEKWRVSKERELLQRGDPIHVTCTPRVAILLLKIPRKYRAVRIQRYISIEQEPASTADGIPPTYWPASGGLRVESLSARVLFRRTRCSARHFLQFRSGGACRCRVLKFVLETSPTAWGLFPSFHSNYSRIPTNVSIPDFNSAALNISLHLIFSEWRTAANWLQHLVTSLNRFFVPAINLQFPAPRKHGISFFDGDWPRLRNFDHPCRHRGLFGAGYWSLKHAFDLLLNLVPISLIWPQQRPMHPSFMTESRTILTSIMTQTRSELVRYIRAKDSHLVCSSTILTPLPEFEFESIRPAVELGEYFQLNLCLPARSFDSEYLTHLRVRFDDFFNIVPCSADLARFSDKVPTPLIMICTQLMAISTFGAGMRWNRAPEMQRNKQKSQGKSVDDITWSHGSGGNPKCGGKSPDTCRIRVAPRHGHFRMQNCVGTCGGKFQLILSLFHHFSASDAQNLKRKEKQDEKEFAGPSRTTHVWVVRHFGSRAHTRVIFKGANYGPLLVHTIHPDTTRVVLQNEIQCRQHTPRGARRRVCWRRRRAPVRQHAGRRVDDHDPGDARARGGAGGGVARLAAERAPSSRAGREPRTAYRAEWVRARADNPVCAEAVTLSAVAAGSRSERQSIAWSLHRLPARDALMGRAQFTQVGVGFDPGWAQNLLTGIGICKEWRKGRQYLTRNSTDSFPHKTGGHRDLGEKNISTSTSSQPVVKKRKLALLSSDKEDTPPKKNRAAGGSRPKPRISKAKDNELALSDEDDTPPPKKFPRKSTAPSKSKKDEEFVVSSGDEELAPKKPAVKAKAGPSKVNGEAAANGKDEEKEQEKEEAPKAKFKAVKLAGPAAPGSKAVPDGAFNCLARALVRVDQRTQQLLVRRGLRYREALRRQRRRAALFEDELLSASDNAGPSKLNAIKNTGLQTVRVRVRFGRASAFTLGRRMCTGTRWHCVPVGPARAPYHPSPLVGCVVALPVPTFGLPRTVGTHHAHLYKVAERAHQAQRAETLAHDEEQTDPDPHTRMTSPPSRAARSRREGGGGALGPGLVLGDGDESGFCISPWPIRSSQVEKKILQAFTLFNPRDRGVVYIYEIKFDPGSEVKAAGPLPAAHVPPHANSRRPLYVQLACHRSRATCVHGPVESACSLSTHESRSRLARCWPLACRKGGNCTKRLCACEERVTVCKDLPRANLPPFDHPVLVQPERCPRGICSHVTCAARATRWDTGKSERPRRGAGEDVFRVAKSCVRMRPREEAGTPDAKEEWSCWSPPLRRILGPRRLNTRFGGASPATSTSIAARRARDCHFTVLCRRNAELPMNYPCMGSSARTLESFSYCSLRFKFCASDALKIVMTFTLVARPIESRWISLDLPMLSSIRARRSAGHEAARAPPTRIRLRRGVCNYGRRCPADRRAKRPRDSGAVQENNLMQSCCHWNVEDKERELERTNGLAYCTAALACAVAVEREKSEVIGDSRQNSWAESSRELAQTRIDFQTTRKPHFLADSLDSGKLDGLETLPVNAHSRGTGTSAESRKAENSDLEFKHYSGKSPPDRNAERLDLPGSANLNDVPVVSDGLRRRARKIPVVAAAVDDAPDNMEEDVDEFHDGSGITWKLSA